MGTHYAQLPMVTKMKLSMCARSWKQLAECVNCVNVNYMRLKISEDKVQIAEMDPMHYRGVRVIITKFRLENCSSMPASVRLCVNDLLRFLKQTHNDEMIVMRANGKNVSFETTDDLYMYYEFEEVIDQTITDGCKWPKSLEFSAQIDIELDRFIQTIMTLAPWRYQLRFIIDDNFIIEAKDTNLDEKLMTDEHGIFSELKVVNKTADIVKSDGVINSVYQSVFLQNIAKLLSHMSNIDDMCIWMSEDYPLNIAFSLPGITVYYLIAPRVNTEY